MTSPTILIVDDERLVRWSLAQHLLKHGYRTVEAATAAEARRLASTSDAPDLVLLDLRLPDMDGLDLLELLLAERPECRVIVLSAYATPEVSRWALEHGASFVTHKPYELDAVEGLIERALDGGPRADPPPRSPPEA